MRNFGRYGAAMTRSGAKPRAGRRLAVRSWPRPTCRYSILQATPICSTGATRSSYRRRHRDGEGRPCPSGSVTAASCSCGPIRARRRGWRSTPTIGPSLLRRGHATRHVQPLSGAARRLHASEVQRGKARSAEMLDGDTPRRSGKYPRCSIVAEPHERIFR